MVRSLWTAATGMIAQQNNVDTISNNLANVNTTGYKAEVNEFKSLLYQNIQTKTTTANGEQKPIGAQVGLGVRNAAISSQFSQGSFLASDNNFAFAIGGEGFFGVRGEDGQTYYTRNGNFNVSLGVDGLTLTDMQGNPVLNTEGEPIVIGSEDDYVATRITVGSDGNVMYPNDEGEPEPIGMSLGLWQFQNPEGLYKAGDTLFSVTAASGEPISEAENDNVVKSTVRQGYLEGSNVQVAEEMVNLIVAQRAYELNSKAITTTDEMMQLANQLKR